jgi:cyclic pyranopterin monophosphate synthase
VKLYAFDGIDSSLILLPIAARRALDHAGLKLSRAGWQSLELDQRQELVTLGSSVALDTDRIRALVAGAVPAAEPLQPVGDPGPAAVPEELSRALGAERPITPAVWSALGPLDRYALVKAAQSKSLDRLGDAYDEIVGSSAFSTHLGPQGGARMVGISEKAHSARRALAESAVTMSVEAFARLERADAPKGDVLSVARIAGIQAAKRTWELIPLCHPLALTRVDMSFELRPAERQVVVRAAVEAFDRTGVEMEALTAASVAALTVYDMLKAFDRGMQIGPTRLLEKSGGRSGDFKR